MLSQLRFALFGLLLAVAFVTALPVPNDASVAQQLWPRLLKGQTQGAPKKGAKDVNVDYSKFRNGAAPPTHEEASRIQGAVDYHKHTQAPQMAGYQTNAPWHAKDAGKGDTKLHMTGPATDAQGRPLPDSQGNAQHHIYLAPAQSYTDSQGRTHYGDPHVNQGGK